MMELSDHEKAMLDGREGAAVSRAMDLLVRYGNALGAPRLIATNNVLGKVSATTPPMRQYAMKQGGMNAVFSQFALDSDEVVDIPKVRAYSTHTQLGFSPDSPELMGLDEQTIRLYRTGEEYITKLGIQATNTCTPYQVGNLPTRGEHCAWMESSAVVYCNSVLGARTNTEGRESAGASMLTARTPYWGYHLPENRFARYEVVLDVDVSSFDDWGVLGYWLGEQIQDQVPTIRGLRSIPNLARLKHFGAAASTSGGVEMFHMIGVTPEAPDLQTSLGGRKPVEVLHFDATQRSGTYERLNATARTQKVDYVMLGCPHYSLEQLWEVANLLEGRKVSANTELWIFTAAAIKAVTDRNGTTRLLEAAGAKLLTDSCSAMSRAVPKGTRVAAFDSAKQAHYLPAMLGIEGWFGSTEQCVEAACTGYWHGVGAE